MTYSGIYFDTSFAHFTPAYAKGHSIGNDSSTPTEPSVLTTLYQQRYGCLPKGTSELSHVEHKGNSWTVGFRGIPRITVFLNILSIMENDLLPQSEQCDFDVVFNFLQDDQLLMTCAAPEFIPNGNTYSNILSFLERTQHLCN